MELLALTALVIVAFGLLSWRHVKSVEDFARRESDASREEVKKLIGLWERQLFAPAAPADDPVDDVHPLDFEPVEFDEDLQDLSSQWRDTGPPIEDQVGNPIPQGE